MRSFIGSWHAQSDSFECGLSFAAELAFDFDVNEPGSRRGAERQTDQGRRMSERKPFTAGASSADPV